MQEIMGFVKILGGAVGFFGFIVTFIAWFVKRTIKQFDDKDLKLQEDISKLKQEANSLVREVAVLQEGKIGRDELKQELEKLGDAQRGQFNYMKEVIRDNFTVVIGMLKAEHK